MIKDVIFYKSLSREFRSNFQLEEAKKILRGTFSSPQTGLNRGEGIIGELNANQLKMAYMYPNLKNPWHSVFVGRFEELDSGSRLVGYYTRSTITKVVMMFSIFLMLLFVLIFLTSAAAVGYTQRVFFVGSGSLAVFSLFFVMAKFCSFLSRKDEIKIDSIVESALACKVSIVPKFMVQ